MKLAVARKNISLTDIKLAKIAAGGEILISLATAACVLIGFLTASLAFEIAFTCFIALACLVCTIHIYQEYQYLYVRERYLKHALLRQVGKQFPHLSQRGLAEYLEKTLQNYSSPQKRIKVLKQYRKESPALAQFIAEYNQENADLSVLEDLGLRWDTHSSNHDDFQIRA